jgi:hypothetical protein
MGIPLKVYPARQIKGVKYEITAYTELRLRRNRKPHFGEPMSEAPRLIFDDQA